MEQFVDLFVFYGPLTLAGAMGGVIRWWTNREPWQLGVAAVVGGAIAGTYLGPAFFTLVQPVTDMTGMDAQDARLLGAHLSGVIGVNLYAIPVDWARARAQALRSAVDKEQQP